MIPASPFIVAFFPHLFQDGPAEAVRCVVAEEAARHVGAALPAAVEAARRVAAELPASSVVEEARNAAVEAASAAVEEEAQAFVAVLPVSSSLAVLRAVEAAEPAEVAQVRRAAGVAEPAAEVAAAGTAALAQALRCDLTAADYLAAAGWAPVDEAVSRPDGAELRSRALAEPGS